jgi:sulfite reductase (ferredoxin)
MLGGGLGSQPHHAELLSEFIPVNQIIQLPKAFKVFDRFGERAKRLKARMKFLIKDIGRDEFRLVDEEKKALSYQSYEIDTTDLMLPFCYFIRSAKVTIEDTAYESLEIKCNAKTSGLSCDRYQSAFRRFYTDSKSWLMIKNYGNELRFHKQNIVLRNIKKNLPSFIKN